MPDRRLALAPRLVAAGLPPSSAATLATLRDVVDEGVLGASNHVALALPLIVRIAAEGDDPERAFRAAEATARFIAETRGAAAPIVANALAWLLDGVPDAPAGDRAALLAARAAQWSQEAGAAPRGAGGARGRGAGGNLGPAHLRLLQHGRGHRRRPSPAAAGCA